MGRITPSFRQRFHKQIEELRSSSGFQNTLINVEHQKAFDLLLREAWSAESAALSNAGLPGLMDVLNLMANVHTKKSVEENRTSIEDLRKQIRELEVRFKEQNVKGYGRKGEVG